MVVQLYLVPDCSPACRAVYMAVKALSLPVELKVMDISKDQDHLKADFLKLNPEHKLPTIVDGEFVLWESRAIMRYLVEKYGGPDNTLYPKDLEQRATVDRLLDYDLGVFHRHILDERIATFRKEVSEEGKKKVTEVHEWLDNQVKITKYVAGNDLTIADFSVLVSFMMFEDTGLETVAKYSHAMVWYKRMQELPYYTECNQPFFNFQERMKKGNDEFK